MVSYKRPFSHDLVGVSCRYVCAVCQAGGDDDCHDHDDDLVF